MIVRKSLTDHYFRHLLGSEGEEVSLKPARLVLEDKKEFMGYSFGYDKSVAGEVVFNTGMVGYPESLTDPSYAGQLLVLTYPLVGNYGVPDDEKDDFGLPKHFEGDRIHVTALIVADYSFSVSHYTAKRTLAEWLQEQRVPGIAGVDTRALTKHIREKGSMLGKLLIGDDVENPECIAWVNPNETNLVAQVSHKEVRDFCEPVASQVRCTAHAAKPPHTTPGLM